MTRRAAPDMLRNNNHALSVISSIFISLCLACALLTVSGTAADAQTSDTPRPATAEHLERAQTLYKEIRCPVCTAQPISESDASLSQNMRARILSEIQAGKTDEDILIDLTRTYGDDIRLSPKKEPRTFALWAAPWVIILLGFLGLLLTRNRRQVGADSEQSDASDP